MVVRTEPTSTTNMTGLRAICRGSSLRTASPTARRRIAGSNIDEERRAVLVGASVSGVAVSILAP